MDINDLVDEIEIPSSMSFASMRNSGKSVMVNAIAKRLLETKKVASVIIFSNTAEYNDDYKDFPNTLKKPYSEEALMRIMNHQKSKKKEERKQVLIIFDDLLGDNDAQNSNLILTCFSLGRHIGLSPINIGQTGNKILTPTCKANSDYIFMSKLNRQQLETIWTAVPYIDKKVFIKFVEDVNKNYQFVVACLRSQSNDPAEFLKIVKCYDV